MNKKLLLAQCENIMSSISALEESDDLKHKANQALRKLKREAIDFIEEVKELRKQVGKH